MPRAARALLTIATLSLLLGPVVGAVGLPPRVEPTLAWLAPATFATSAIWTGEAAYVFGGWSHAPFTAGLHDTIQRFDPATGAVEVLEARLPFPVSWTSAVWTGEHAFVFGGVVNRWSDANRVVRFTPATGEVALMEAVFPHVNSRGRTELLWLTSAVWDGEHAYVFGNGGRVYRYDPLADTATLLPTRLPGAPEQAAAVWDGTHAYVFGGVGDAGWLDTIVRFTPSTGAAVVLDTRLPFPRVSAAAAFDGRYAYLLGGLDNHVLVNNAAAAPVLRFDTASATVDVLPAFTPLDWDGPSAVWTGSEAYVLGGTCVCHTFPATDGAIYRFTP